MNEVVRAAWTEIWNVYKISFEDGYAYVGMTNQPIADRIHAHLNNPVNAELAKRLTGDPYTYECLHEVECDPARKEDITEVYRLEREEILKLEQPINICGISAEAKARIEHRGHKPTDRRKRKRKRNVHPPREGIYRCSICAENKQHTEFHVSKDRFNGLDSRCKDCRCFTIRTGMSSDEARDYIANGGSIDEARRYKKRIS